MTDDPPRQLGALTLHHLLGQGAQGAVWHAVHGPTGRPLAVKVLRTTAAATFQRLRQEAEAMARLAHPGVVAILDVGRVTAGDASPDLPEGAPWLAMELIEGAGVLHPDPGRDWKEIRRILFALLDALAHCHARDVIHRDLKPGNILVRDSRVCLTDFGLAWLGAEADASLRAGTPPYMAPEQFLGATAGPRTDLYALGCVAAQLVQGRPPFAATTLSAWQQQHLYAPPPPLQPAMPVPEGFEPWVRRLLAKLPDDRYGSAAQAADGLALLGPPTTTATSGDSLVEDTATWMSELPLSSVLDPVLPTQVALTLTQGARRPPPPRWQAPYPQPLDDIVRAGIGLHALRQPPMVGREAARDALWTALRLLTRTGGSRVVQVLGPPGSGRRTLLRWFGERARELDVATVCTRPEEVGEDAPPYLLLLDAPVHPVPTPDDTLVVVAGSLDGPRDPDHETVILEPLPYAEIRQLLEHRLDLDPVLTIHLAWLSDGHPGLAVALLQEVLPRLERTPSGYRLPAGAPLPDPAPHLASLQGARWSDRPLHRLLALRPPPEADPTAWHLNRAAEAEGVLRAEHLAAAGRIAEAKEALAACLSPGDLARRRPTSDLGAVQALRRLLEHHAEPDDPLHSLADVVEGVVCADLGLADRARTLARRVLQRPDGSATYHRHAHVMLGKLAIGEPGADPAPHYRAALALPRPPHPTMYLRLWRGLLVALRRSGRTAEVEEALEQLARDPDLQAWSVIERGHHDRAMKRPMDLPAIQATLAATDDPEVLKAGAGLMLASNKPDVGELLLRRALALGAGTPVTRLNLAWLLASQGRHEEARALVGPLDHADAESRNSLMLLKAFLHAADAQVDVLAYLHAFEPHRIAPAFTGNTAGALLQIAVRAEAAGLVERAAIARRHAVWLGTRNDRPAGG